MGDVTPVMRRMAPPEGSAYVGCPDCGNVTTVPSDGTPDDMPWCPHHDGRVLWRKIGNAAHMLPVRVSRAR